MGEDLMKREKIQRFEEFVDRRLKPDLVNAIAQRNKVFEQQKVFSDLKRNIENLQKNGVTSLRTMVNLGSEVYMQADAPDTRHIFVDIGMGFHVEFTWSEALEFISVREARLARALLSLSSLSSGYGRRNREGGINNDRFYYGQAQLMMFISSIMRLCIQHLVVRACMRIPLFFRYNKVYSEEYESDWHLDIALPIH